MSDPQPILTSAPAPVDYTPAALPTGAARPAAVNFIAGIGIFLGALFVLCKPANLMVQMLVKLPQPNPVLDALRTDPTLRAFGFFSTLTGTLISLLLLLSSLGSLALKPWGRMGMFAYAGLALAMTVAEHLVATYVVGPEIERVMRQSGTPMPPGTAWMSGWIGTTLVLLLKVWYPALILYLFTRPHVKSAFEHGLGGKGI